MPGRLLVQFFEDVEDPRTGNRRRYELTELLVICDCAVGPEPVGEGRRGFGRRLPP